MSRSLPMAVPHAASPSRGPAPLMTMTQVSSVGSDIVDASPDANGPAITVTFDPSVTSDTSSSMTSETVIITLGRDPPAGGGTQAPPWEHAEPRLRPPPLVDAIVRQYLYRAAWRTARQSHTTIHRS